ncbi:MAG: deoxyribodipyrimidine photo-lyase [Buchnera aphidicola (Meitanaphis elongallis)]
MKTNLIWFRNDLRIRDNFALYSACKDETSIILALFIFTPEQWKFKKISSKKICLIYKNVISLRKELIKLNIVLHCYTSTTFLKSINYLIKFCKLNQVNHLYYNYEYDFISQKRDNIVIKKLQNCSIFSSGFHGSTLIKPGSITNQKGEMYKKYSCFKKKCIMLLPKELLNHVFIAPKKRKITTNKLHYRILSRSFSLKRFDEKLFPIGERKVLKILKYFLKKKFGNYDVNRNNLTLNSTSMLSAHLSIGIISPSQCLHFLFKSYPNVCKYSIEKCSWINELIWREFFKHSLFFFPFFSKQQVLCHWEHNIRWKNDMKTLNAWKKGKTGFPIVDAGMRQLNKLGWMHNRLRMITSSFLVKNLLINWKQGEKYFILQLIDGDLALNNGGWQWIASIGSDSVPYFRMFNPILQSKKFDKQGKFIKKYVPELKIISASKIHDPNLWNKTIREQINYPKPIINLVNSKKETLRIFKLAKYKI